MRTPRLFLCLVLVLGLAAAARAQAVNIQTPEQLQKLLAPVALFDDGLLATILTATTVPGDISQAATWRAANPGPLTAMPDKDWDPAVKALLSFPPLLTKMSSNTGWTRKVGQAMLAQPQDVLAAIQAYRAMLDKSGALDGGGHLVVTNTGGAVVLAPVDPTTLYVPLYSTADYDYYRPSVTWSQGVPVGPWWGYRTFNWPSATIVLAPDRLAAFNYPAGSRYGQETSVVWAPSQASHSAYASYRAAAGTPDPNAPPPPPSSSPPPSSTMQGSANDWSSNWDYNGGTYDYGYGYGYGYGAVAPGVTAARVDAWAGANNGAIDNAAGQRGGASRPGTGFGGRRR